MHLRTSSRRSLAALALLFAFTTIASADLSIKPGDQLVRVDVQTQAQLAQLEAMNLDVWSHEYGVGPIDIHVSTAELDQLASAGFTFTIENADLHAERLRELAELAAPRGPGDFTAYKDFDGIAAFINNLAAARPDLCSVTTYGTSLEGRPLYLLKITGPGAGPKPAVFYHSLIHCREWITGPVVLYFANYLVNNYDADPCVADLVNSTEFYLAPCVNPDGYVYTWGPERLWRKNRRNNGNGSFGVDLNRNFGYHWGEAGASASSLDETYRGPSAFSEPETQALRDFVDAHPNIRAYMDYHSYSQLILWPWGYTDVYCPDNDTYDAVGGVIRRLILNEHGAGYIAGPINTTIYPASGGSVDWVYGAHADFKLAYSIELPPTGSPGFILPADQIIPVCEENLPALLYLSRFAASPVLIELADALPQKILAGQPQTITASVVAAQESLAPGSATLHYRLSADDAFTALPLTLQSGSDYAATLPPAACGDTLEFYIVAAGTEGGIETLPCGAPDSVYAIPVVAEPVRQIIQNTDFSSNPGWTLGSNWTFGQPTGICGDPTSGFTGNNVYGYRFIACYQNNINPARYLTTTAIDCTGFSDIQLQFRRWLGIESANFDHATIEASIDGSNWTAIWNHTGDTFQETAWSLQTVDLPPFADNQANVRIRWGMGPTDGGLGFSGWNIDDVEILGAPLVDCSGVTPGDVNGDTLLDARDIEPFVSVLLNPEAASANETCAADVNQSCGVTMDDVALFANLLLQ